MACKQYFVVLHEGQWTVKFEDQPEDPYPTQSKAIRAAIDAAHLIGSKGEDAQVLVQIENAVPNGMDLRARMSIRPRTELSCPSCLSHRVRCGLDRLMTS